ncbi:hypothetical protein GHT06_018892 [Daphnia sinensis]|uniref:tRNA pseudouridine synthase n=1 Tax=Daphnia sinensis TaxID=1820382 RepID=A0AAD5PSN1_9CRUS|nr:hypothetical protein GHT06_018892 [Daphnia sinensis]
MQRYLIKFAYSGIRFRGLQKQPGEIFNGEFPCRASIQTIFEKALLRLPQYEKAPESNIQFSSRTDQGVHSFCNVAHFDLTLQKDVNSVEAVPPTFHARYSSFYRHYLYRIAVTDKDVKAYPIVEWKKCFFIPKPFCLDKAVKACKLFEGTKDFASFCHHFNQKPSGYPTIRTIDHFYIKPGRSLFDPVYDPLYSNIEFYDFHVKARSFMYKQVFLRMSNLRDLLKIKGKNLRRVTTRVTLPNGRVFHEADGMTIESEKSHGFVVDNTPDLQLGQVEHGIYIASQDVANDPELIRKHAITHVLNVAGCPSQKLPGLHYLDVYILDLPEESLCHHFSPCFEFMDDALKTGCVLVHCNAGISRSASIVVAYLMCRRQKSLNEALRQVKAARPKANPNVGFLHQLQKYEINIAGKTDPSSAPIS